MSCVVVFSSTNKPLEGKKFASHAALARKMSKGEQCTVQETSGNWQGWYRVVGCSDDGKTYWTSRPKMEY